MSISERLDVVGTICLFIAIFMTAFVVMTMMFYEYTVIRTIGILAVPSVIGIISFITSNIVRGIETR